MAAVLPPRTVEGGGSLVVQVCAAGQHGDVHGGQVRQRAVVHKQELVTVAPPRGENRQTFDVDCTWGGQHHAQNSHGVICRYMPLNLYMHTANHVERMLTTYYCNQELGAY